MPRAIPLPASLRTRGPFAAWMTLSAALGLGGVLETLLSHGDHKLVGVLATAGMGVAVALAWRRPLLAAALQLAVTLAQLPFDDPLYDVAIAIYALGAVIGMGAARTDGRRFVLVFLLGALTTAGVLAPKTEDPVTDPIVAALFLGGLPTLVGRMFRSRTQLNTELRERSRRLTEDRQTRAQEAAAEERRRIAGELHDLVTHGVSGMVVQAGAARRLVRAGDPRAAEAILAVEDGGREALAELRRLLGVLRHDDRDVALAPQPSLRHLGALVAGLREQGLAVELRVEGEPLTMGPGADLAGYRVVEDLLGAARRSDEASPLSVLVRYEGRTVELSVDGTEPSAADLVALRERLRLFGGELRGARRGVRVRLPLRAVTA